MNWWLRNLKSFFEDDFCRPSDFIDIDWRVVRENITECFLLGIITFILYLIIALFLMIQYYITLPFRILNETSEWWTY